MALFTRPTTARGLRVMFMSSFVPRECGLATFTEDVLSSVMAHGVEGKVIAMNRPGEDYPYDNRVAARVRENLPADYQSAADIINHGGFDVLSIQHEFGIFGGAGAGYLTDFLKLITIPIVTTFHTILQQPSRAIRDGLRAVAQRSDAIVVMNSMATPLLESVYELDTRRVNMIHHGAPMVPATQRNSAKKVLGLQTRKVISTFGLLSSGKGLEYAVKAMPRIVSRHPDALYLILGQTHPVVKQEEGERYRESLQRLAEKLGIANQVRFVDSYLSKEELIRYLLATDIYLTPYLNMEQVTSGTLAYAMACGRSLVSTPYLYAQFLLDGDRGLLVPPRDPEGIADACLMIFDHPELKANMERMNWQYGREMSWPQIGLQYQRLFHQIAAARPAAQYAVDVSS